MTAGTPRKHVSRSCGGRGHFRVLPASGTVIEMGEPAAASDPPSTQARHAWQPFRAYGGYRPSKECGSGGDFEGDHSARRWRPIKAQLPIAGGEAGMKARCGIPSVKLTILHVVR